MNESIKIPDDGKILEVLRKTPQPLLDLARSMNIKEEAYKAFGNRVAELLKTSHCCAVYKPGRGLVIYPGPLKKHIDRVLA